MSEESISIRFSRACCRVGNRNEKPDSINLFGMTLWPFSTMFANSPRRVRNKKAGALEAQEAGQAFLPES